MIIQSMQVFGGDIGKLVPWRVEMIVDDITMTRDSSMESWEINEYGAHGVTFWSQLHRCEVDPMQLGSRYDIDLMKLYGDTPTREYLITLPRLEVPPYVQGGSDYEGWSIYEGWYARQGWSNPHPGYFHDEQARSIYKGGSVAFEGRFNSLAVLPCPVYPVTVFTEDSFVSRDIFFPVPYVDELLHTFCPGWTLGPNRYAALHGDIVFELVNQGHLG